jgi:hypothetical protein
MIKLPTIEEKDELCSLIEDIGFLPLFKCSIPGFSVEDITVWERWFSDDDSEHDPWKWRKAIAAQGEIAYGKLFNGKAGYISKKWYPKFVNYRRDGYDFDSLYDEGLAPRRQSIIMKLFEDGAAIPSYEIKKRAGFGGGGEKGFEGTMTALQMQTYLIVCGFARRRNKAGAEYGWPIALYTTPEALFGADFVRSEYKADPKQSLAEIAEHCAMLFGDAGEETILKFIGR